MRVAEAVLFVTLAELAGAVGAGREVEAPHAVAEGDILGLSPQRRQLLLREPPHSQRVTSFSRRWTKHVYVWRRGGHGLTPPCHATAQASSSTKGQWLLAPLNSWSTKLMLPALPSTHPTDAPTFSSQSNLGSCHRGDELLPGPANAVAPRS